MKDWIKKTIDPPGIDTKKRGSLFDLIGEVFGITKKDAIKAFNAHFPYLADSQKLREHGASLSIPFLAYDSEEEYRDRVSTASFYLSKAGERKYILDNLKAHFGDRYVITEEFLQVYLRVSELTEKDRVWIFSFLDNLLDPNISLNVAEWFQFFETLVALEELAIIVKKDFKENFSEAIKYNGAIKYDGFTTNIYLWAYGFYNGAFFHNGFLRYSGIGKKINDPKPIPPFKYRSIIADVLTMNLSYSLSDDVFINDSLLINYRNHNFHNGVKHYSGIMKYNSGILFPLGGE